MATFFVCKIGENSYSHREYDTLAEAEASAADAGWVITVEGGTIVDMRADTPGPAVRAVRRALKWRQPVPAAPSAVTVCDVCLSDVHIAMPKCPKCGAVYDAERLQFIAAGGSRG